MAQLSDQSQVTVGSSESRGPADCAFRRVLAVAVDVRDCGPSCDKTEIVEVSLEGSCSASSTGVGTGIGTGIGRVAVVHDPHTVTKRNIVFDPNTFNTLQ